MIKNYNNSFIQIPKIHSREWGVLVRHFPVLTKCRRKHDPRHIPEAIFHLLRSGCQWRLLPECYPHWKSVYNKWRYLNAKGIFTGIHRFLLENARKKSGRNESPTICFIDSASRCSGLSDSVKGVDGFGRRVVERLVSWLDNCRRLVRNYERECTTASYMTVTSDIYRLLRHL